MDMLPMSSMSETRRQNQYLADVTRENEERPRRNEKILDPDLAETRDRWNATQAGGMPHRWPPAKGYFHSVIT